MAYQTVNPANNQLIKQYAAHSDADVEAALQKADALYHSAWSKGDIDRRLPVLHRLADLIDSRVEELAKIASQEMGKLIAQSRGEVKLCAQIARYYADNAKSFLAPVKYPSAIGMILTFLPISASAGKREGARVLPKGKPIYSGWRPSIRLPRNAGRARR